MLCGASDDTVHPLGMIASRLLEQGLDANDLGGFSVISPLAMKHFAKALAALSD